MRCISRAKSAALVCVALISLFTGGCIGGKGATPVTAYELKNYNQDLYQGKLYAEELCVAQNDVALEGYTEDTELHSAALFDLTGERVLYSYKAHERLYPASTTKLMTVCGLAKGEVWTLRDLLGALLLYSGNDAATAIAEYVGGSEEAFVNMMNRRAQELMANGTHFMNPHGLHDDNHYTTAYDLYLIFNECIKHEDFVNIIQSEAYTAYYTDVDGNSQEALFTPTNLYAQGEVDVPENVTIVGGKTGTTDEAGYCLILMEKDSSDNPYISIVMGASEKPVLYEDMTSLIEAIPSGQQ